MKTMFSNSVFSRDYFSVPAPVQPYRMAGPWLGQDDISYVDEGTRQKVVVKVDDANKKMPALNDVVSLSSDMNLYRSFMEPDSMAFLQLSNDAAALYPTVKAVYDRFSGGNAEDYYATGAELAAVDQWSQKVGQMYGIFLVHFPQNAPVKTPVKPGPSSAPAAVVAPPAVTSNNVPKPQVPGRPAAAIPGAPSAPTIFGTDANNVLIGGGLALGLGVLIYAIL